MSKASFINNETWLLSINGAFQRANVYKQNVPEKEKVYFKRVLKVYIDDVQNVYHTPVTETEHLENIKGLMGFTATSSSILTNGQFNFGVAQKLLNLYLKYRWCLGNIPAPPHFPVDSIIQRKLGLKVMPWTKMEDETEYLKIIRHAKKQLETYDCNSLAELELLLFSRNNDLKITDCSFKGWLKI
ncbi:hypothetical protein [Aestuariibaculum sediminum]|uniref:Uncharacterized protein n=1 Tax=Aestuariibaculum sediminum TaxID=2770637 RepID=A0A8J6QLB1_9FLAO|nr:hypothetical protein [Aestuariibaculum sediminum]MBD0833364.1 hypothetical protein [Aestuariibaculum sediminum]